MLSDTDISSSLDPRVRFHHPRQCLLVVSLFLVKIDHFGLFHILPKCLEKLVFHFIRDVQSKVQIRRFLEFPFPDVAAFAVVLRSRNPGDTVVVVEIETLLPFVFRQVRKAIVVDENRRSSCPLDTR